MRYLIVFLVAISFLQKTKAQQNIQDHLIYVDNKGVIRYTLSGTEASFFGTNYTVPFAYGYRSLNYLNKKHEDAIDEDVYHFSRLGFNAFRVHIWDVEISDSAGNLINNEHLRLFDYLVNKLKEYNIRIFLTPIAFWGNGYPERDQKTPGFSTGISKKDVLIIEDKIKAQENYIRQLCKHINRYTNLTYGDDPNIIAMEINNEPHHSGPSEMVTTYINRMVESAKSTGWTKPIFYNISESPAYAKAVAESNIQGVSFQWYPTGLVANRSQKGNYLPNTHHYAIPFDTIAAFKNKALMVYEFDAGDVPGSIMYPAMARSFRTAGFQWATQFAYDPMTTAFANTEYQTHYVNLAYTPSKAISLMVAAKVFHYLNRNEVPLNDTLFGPFRISYHNNLSEFLTDDTFIYSNNTNSYPPSISKLTLIAGVGNSPLVQYPGTGAYFLDKISKGIWRLELMPDAVTIADPFARASLHRTVTRINHSIHPFSIALPDLGNNYNIQSLQDKNAKTSTATGNSINLKPGVYLLLAKEFNSDNPKAYAKLDIVSNTFYAPPGNMDSIEVMHEPPYYISQGLAHQFKFTISGVNRTDKMNLLIWNSAGQRKSISLQQESPYTYFAIADPEFLPKGPISYQLLVHSKEGSPKVFPANVGISINGGHVNTTWESIISGSSVELFNANRDRSRITTYQPDWQNGKLAFSPGATTGTLQLNMSLTKNSSHHIFGFEFYTGDIIKHFDEEFKMIELSTAHEHGIMKITLIDVHGNAFSHIIDTASQHQISRLPVTEFYTDNLLLLPRPYPSFQPLFKTSASAARLSLKLIERIQVMFYRNKDQNKNAEFSIEWIRLMK